MSKQQFAEVIKVDRPRVVPEHLTLKGILNDLGRTLKHQVEAGSHEMAALLFRGDAFVMYGNAGGQQEQQQNRGRDR